MSDEQKNTHISCSWLVMVFQPDKWAVPGKWSSQERGYNGKANASLFCGIISVFIHVLVPIFSPLAIALGNTAKKEILESGSTKGEMKIEWGIALGKTGLAFFAVDLLIIMIWLIM